ncbi:MAG TPA: two-component system response regulator, partial [Mycobacterium sp.]
SARRYLEHYLSTGTLEIRLQYGAGRPERRYRASTASPR